MGAETQLTSVRLPAWTLAISASALIVFSLPELQAVLIFDRDAIARGEIWRLATGNLVHLSPTHLAYDLAAFAIAGTIIEICGYRLFPALVLASATLIGIVLLAETELHYFAGLSGVVAAAVTYLCLYGLFEQGAWRWLCVATLAGVIFKSGAELMLDTSLLLAVSTNEFLPVPLSHLAGTVTAMLLFAWTRNSTRVVHREHAPGIGDE